MDKDFGCHLKTMSIYAHGVKLLSKELDRCEEKCELFSICEDAAFVKEIVSKRKDQDRNYGD